MRPIVITLAVLASLALPRAATADFDTEIATLLARRCLECHSGADPKGDLDLTRKEAVTGKDGPVVPGKLDKSLLWELVAADEMPPKKPLDPREKALLKTWIEGGAKWGSDPIDLFAITTDKRAGRDWWSLQPVKRPEVPGTPNTKHKTLNPIDAFIRKKLSDSGLSPAPPADRRTLIRRVYYDLVGFPPTFAEVEGFARDETPDAYEKLVDRLLASPHFGERWGRYWLDIVRYSETSGYERDQEKPNIWKYRDWVIDAINQDMPFKSFVTRQLAGDELPKRSTSDVIATGFIRLGTWNDEPNDPNEYKYDRLEDMVGTTSTAFLGLTVRCARCHDHKFDPIRQTDYYRMAAAFWAGPIEPGPRELLGGPDAKTLGVENVFGWTDRGRDVPPLRLLKKGDPNRPGPIVEPGQLSAIPHLDRTLLDVPPAPNKTRRRWHLARWIIDSGNPLTARVWVNRLWQYHFGFGLVRTPDNFGFTGEKPTHPELLDWLASELMNNGWRSKRIHRLILLSETYRQSSLHPKGEEYAKTDSGNRLWWRAERRRLDAEALRDSLLFVAGKLDLEKRGGPGFRPNIPADALEGLSMKGEAWKPSPPAEQNRRSVYIFAKRGLLSPLLTTFDFPDTTLPSCQRDVTTVPTQALALLNNPFVHEQSLALAKRIGTGGSQVDQVKRTWQLALGRAPRTSEAEIAVAHLEKQAKAFAARREPHHDALVSLCHVLLNCNEFVYVD